MKKIINGKLYDTDTAKEMGTGCASCSPRDFHYYSETLYRKRTGEYFLYGEGGPASRYAERVDNNMWSGGAKIIPLDLKGAMEWAEQNLRAEEYEAIFGTPDEGGEHLHVVLDAALMAALRARAAEDGVSVTAAVGAILREALKG